VTLQAGNRPLGNTRRMEHDFTSFMVHLPQGWIVFLYLARCYHKPTRQVHGMSKDKPAIFINYRRALSTKEARQLYLMLSVYFPNQVFQDERSLDGGDVWNEEIGLAILNSKIFLSLIPPKWVSHPLDEEDINKDLENKNRADLHWRNEDPVRKEIETALSVQGITIIPVLLNNAKQPADWKLPESIRSLFQRNLANEGRPLNFDSPNIDEFLKFFENIASKARLEVDTAHNSNLFRTPLDKDFPLPDELAELLPQAASPFVGLKPFKRADARIFFGRSREIYDLCHKVLRVDKPRLLLLDGYSGTGKSSLLQAGLIPRIEQAGWAVVYGRREQDKVYGLSGVFQSLLKEAEGKAETRKLIILDQVEEAVYNRIEGLPRELEQLADDIKVAVLNHPNYKFILGFRSEMKGRIEEVLRKVQLPFDAENTLYPLDLAGVREAINGVVEENELRNHYMLQFTPPDLYERLAKQLLKGWEHYHIAPLVQVNMEMLWNRCRQADGTVHITEHHLNGLIDRQDGLLDYYLRLVREELSEAQLDDQKILELLYFHVENEPTSATRLLSQFEKEERFQQNAIYQKALEELRKRYLLLDVESKGEPATRLSHDVLARVIQERYEKLTEEKLDERTKALFEELIVKLDTVIYQLQYHEAHVTLQRLFGLQARSEELRPYFRELLFFWTEANRLEPARQVLQMWLDSQLLSAQLSSAIRQISLNDSKSVRAWLEQENPNAYAELFKKYYAPTDTVMVNIPGGKLKIGEEEETRPVEVRSFRLANTPTTWWKYGLYLFAENQEVALQEKAPNWGLHGNHPAVNVHWYEAVEYCNWLSGRMGLGEVYEVDKSKDDPDNKSEKDTLKWVVTRRHKANGFRLPTEIEWEFAARGGLKSKGYTYAGSNELKAVGWFDENSSGKTHPVGQLRHNELGLYDMSGNVWEWCGDWHGHYPRSIPLDYAGAKGGFGRVLRGGSWYNHEGYSWVKFRHGNNPGNRTIVIGFRLAQDLGEILDREYSHGRFHSSSR
jgi:formylglycine-generating enzyme required for sulfatase activity